ncbi:FmdB family zinc ribbon protein [Brachyspira pilosicoli]|uniref:Zinc ribbon domain-containing protein n=1 Tax=Brachyspira pilosicoli TaxID=52584 RepID=A0A5C8FAP4_BRAPL|nr:zinc ribbon domain-containing protein [Brachyspira pilosicoli]TXJ46292.1 zinc ribbon domain-containing protein [Brachyspira pilosicoli]
MPTYEYKCKKCGHEFEEFQSMTAEPKAKCPVCKGSAKRIISLNVGVIFKGSGFYVNDYKGKNSTSSSSSSSNKPKISCCGV